MVIAITFNEPGPKDRLTKDEVEDLFRLAQAQHDFKATSPARQIFWVRNRDWNPGRMS